MQLVGLFVYPVKSLRGCAVDAAAVDTLGLEGDRRFLVVDRDGRFLTQRVLPRMARIETALTADRLVLRAEGASEVAVSRMPEPGAPLRSVTIWKSEGLLAEDCGDEPARFLTDVLQTECRLVRIGERFLRPILKPNIAAEGDVVHFADSFPFLVISDASLRDLNDRLIAQAQEPVPMNRFRPNLVVSGCEAFAEDTWTRFRIGDVVFRAAGRCDRCILTTTDQLSGERSGPEPLRTLATYRRRPTNPSLVDFGQNLIHETKSGALRVGDELVFA